MMNITQERRAKPRIDCNYPAIVEGFDTDGSKFNNKAMLANLSASGLYMMIDRCIETGAELSITILLSDSSLNNESPRLSTNGTVVRVEQKTEQMCGIAVKFNRYRFL